MKRVVGFILFLLFVIGSLMLQAACACAHNSVYGNWISNGDGTHSKVCTKCDKHIETEECNFYSDECKVCNGADFSQGLEYQLVNNDTEYQVIGMGSCVDSYIIIPHIHEGKKVIKIADGAFQDQQGIVSVKMFMNMESIGSNAFSGCSNLAYVTISDSIISIGEKAFYDCALKTVIIHEDVISIGYCAFSNREMTIYCKGEKARNGWNSSWYGAVKNIVWNYTGNR